MGCDDSAVSNDGSEDTLISHIRWYDTRGKRPVPNVVLASSKAWLCYGGVTAVISAAPEKRPVISWSVAPVTSSHFKILQFPCDKNFKVFFVNMMNGLRLSQYLSLQQAVYEEK